MTSITKRYAAPSVRFCDGGISYPDLSEGVVCALPMQENQGDLFDACGKLNWTVAGSSVSVAGPNATNIPRARDFGGSDWFSQNADWNETVDFTSDWSFSIWIKSTTQDDMYLSQYKYTTNNRCFLLYVPSGTDKYTIIVSDDGTATTTLAWGTTQSGSASWFHLSGYVNGSEIGLSRNGGTFVTASHTGRAYQSTSATPYIGKYDDSPAGEVSGSIAQCVFWQRQLTQAEVALLYNSGNGLAMYR